MSKFSINRLDRYIIGKYVKTFLLALALIIIIVITFDVSEKLDDFIRNNAPTTAIVFQYYLNFIPNFFNLYSPLFIFIAVLFFTAKMASRSEIIAILSSGISYRRMLRPYLYGALIFAVLVSVIGNFIIPLSNVQLKEFEGQYIKTVKRSYYSNLHFQSSKGVQVSAFSYDVNEGSAIIFQQDTYDTAYNLVDRIAANKLTYDSASGNWKAIAYHHRTIDGDKETLTSKAQAELTLDLLPEDFNEASKQISTMNSIELYRHIQKEKMRGSGAVIAAQLEFYQRLLNPFAIIVMTFIGVAISSRKTRGGIGVHLAIGISLAFAFIVFMRMCSVYSLNGNLSPFLAVLLPQLVFGIAAAYLIKKAPK